MTHPTTSGELALHVLRLHAAAFAEHAPHARANNDREHVHQARVATRRMRAALRLFEDILPTEVRGLNDELAWIAAQLGAVRDLDVQLARLAENAEALDAIVALAPYNAWLDEQRTRAFAALDDAFQSVRFAALMNCFQQLETTTPDAATDLHVADDAPKRLRSAYRRLRKRGRDLGAGASAAAFHQVRIRAKRLRYATEFFAALYGKPAQRLIRTSTALQDLLGDFHDGVVCVQHVHEAMHTAAGAWPVETALALGRLVQWEAQRGDVGRRRYRASYREVRDAWKRLRRVL